MYFSVLFEVRGRSEFLSTFIALEGLFTSVDFLVSLQVGYLNSMGMTRGGVPV